MSLAIDHVLHFVPAGFPAEARLAELGLTIGFGREHHGQGTANRLLLLEENYLEFIWVSERADAEQNPLRLDRRADWELTHASPFGVALRGSIPDNLRGEFWKYELEGLPRGLWMHRATTEDARLPLVFVFESEEGPVPRPPDQGFPPALFDHPALPAGARIEKATFVTRVGWPESLTNLLAPMVYLRRGDANRLRVQITGAPTVSISPLMVLEG